MGAVRDLEVPLGEPALLHGRGAALAETPFHLLVGEDRLAGRAPVDGALHALGESSLVKLEEEPLSPPIVVGSGRVDCVLPVEHAPDSSQLSREILHILRDEIHWMDPHLQSEVLGVDPKGVESHGLEHILAQEPMKPAVHVRSCEGIDVPYMKPFGGGVGEHHEVVEGRLRGPQLIEGEAIRAPLLPNSLPLLLHLTGEVSIVLVARHVSNSFLDGQSIELPRPGIIIPREPGTKGISDCPA